MDDVTDLINKLTDMQHAISCGERPGGSQEALDGKNVKLSKLFVSQSRPCLGISSLCAVIVTSTYRASVEQPAESSHPKPLPHAER